MSTLFLYGCGDKPLVIVSPRGANKLLSLMPDSSHQSTVPDADSLYQELLATDLFSIYRNAFEQVTGQTLALIHPNIISTPEAESARCQNDFCSLMLDTEICKNRCTDNTLDLSKRIDQQALTATCEANVTTTLIPIKVNGETVGYLRSGQVRTNEKELDQAFLDRVTQSLPPHVSKSLAQSYQKAKVYDKADYHAQLTLLGAFALQLSELASHRIKAVSQPTSGVVESTKRLIHEKLSEKICLDDLAKHVNVTNSYLCKQFKKATGLTVVEYVNRHRIELAKELLTSKNIRIIEIAYEAGFQSLSQFNRSFHRYTGQSPTQYKNRSTSGLAS